VERFLKYMHPLTLAIFITNEKQYEQLKPISVSAQLSLFDNSCVEIDIYLIAHNTDTQRDVTCKIKIACRQCAINVTFFII
jgi:hypothetical protein